jgi:hypothetical protein
MYSRLPIHVQSQARRAYQLFRQDPSHPGLNFKKVNEENNVYSARVGLGYRVLGQIEGSEIVWFWIGSHSDYDKVV